MLLLSVHEHNKGMRSPPMLTIYWLLLLVVETVRMRTFILRFQVSLRMVVWVDLLML